MSNHQAANLAGCERDVFVADDDLQLLRGESSVQDNFVNFIPDGQLCLVEARVHHLQP